MSSLQFKFKSQPWYGYFTPLITVTITFPSILNSFQSIIDY